jgi:hypothetical protein
MKNDKGHWLESSIFYSCGKIRTVAITITKIPVLEFLFLWCYSLNIGLGLPPWNSPFHFGLLDLRHSVGLLRRVISSSQGLYLYTNTEKCTSPPTHTHTQTPNIHALTGIRNHGPSFRASENSTCLRPLGYRDRPRAGVGPHNSGGDTWLRALRAH